MNLFFIAESLGKTVDELLLGYPVPISNIECAYWPAYQTLKNEMQEKSNKASNRSGKDSSINNQLKKTMGQ